MLGYFFILMTVLLTVFGQLILKWQMSQTGELPQTVAGKFGFIGQALLSPWVWMGLAAAFAASLFWMLALKKLPISTAYPFTASSFVLIVIFAALFMDEPLTMAKLLGTVLIVAGITIVALG